MLMEPQMDPSRAIAILESQFWDSDLVMALLIHLENGSTVMEKDTSLSNMDAESLLTDVPQSSYGDNDHAIKLVDLENYFAVIDNQPSTSFLEQHSHQQNHI